MLNEIIRKATANMNKTKTTKYNIEPEKVEKTSLEDDIFREKSDFCRLQKVGKNNKKIQRYSIKKDSERRQLREPLNLGEKVLVLAERLKKKEAPGRLYKSTAQNESFFKKDKIFIVKKRVQTTSNNWYYWQELYALEGQWM